MALWESKNLHKSEENIKAYFRRAKKKYIIKNEIDESQKKNYPFFIFVFGNERKNILKKIFEKTKDHAERIQNIFRGSDSIETKIEEEIFKFKKIIQKNNKFFSLKFFEQKIHFKEKILYKK